MTPCSSCRARTKSPIAGPSTRSIGRVSSPTTWTSMSRARNAAAASSPMKLAPITMARRAPSDEAMIARQSASERNTWTWGWSAPGIGSRTGSAPVASSKRSYANGFAAGEDQFARLGIDRRDFRIAAADRYRLRCKNRPAAAAASPPARCRRDNPLTGSAGPPALRPRCSASRCCRKSPGAAASRRRQSPPRHRRRSRFCRAHRPQRSRCGFGCARFCRTKMRSPWCSTSQTESEFNAGARVASPVRKSKQA